MEIYFVRHAQTQMNVDKKFYDNFGPFEYYPITEHGKKQAIVTGKHINKMISKQGFDAIYTSPRHRCIETAKEIIKQLDNMKTDQIVTSDLLLEVNAGILNGKTYAEFENIINDNDNFIKLRKNIENEINPIQKMILKKQFVDELHVFLNRTPNRDVLNNYITFINDLASKKHTRVLIVAHNGTLNMMKYIMTGTSIYANISLVPNEYIQNNNYEKIADGNCNIMVALYSKQSRRYQLISPPNTLHLIDLENNN